MSCRDLQADRRMGQWPYQTHANEHIRSYRGIWGSLGSLGLPLYPWGPLGIPAGGAWGFPGVPPLLDPEEVQGLFSRS